MSTNSKFEFYKSVAREFTETVKALNSVKEVAIFASVAGNDLFPTDIDVALFISSSLFSMNNASFMAISVSEKSVLADQLIVHVQAVVTAPISKREKV